MQWILGTLLILSSVGILIVKKPVQASLCFMLTLLTLAALYLELSAEFIAAIQILIYAGAILVLFMFVIVLFQDAHQQIDHKTPQSKRAFLLFSAAVFIGALLYFIARISGWQPGDRIVNADYGTAHSLGRLLYIDFFFPFEALIVIFLAAAVGALYIGRKESPNE
ncbi:MAG: NADH-quinone oxidoreductase subunit J [Parachlamydia sp.]|jgi:NADH-quinone oxidoreductase subunit J|nr:NADH-quinone oxidoreductase subunit J [Parachlamydia sp.]